MNYILIKKYFNEIEIWVNEIQIEMKGEKSILN